MKSYLRQRAEELTEKAKEIMHNLNATERGCETMSYSSRCGDEGRNSDNWVTKTIETERPDYTKRTIARYELESLIETEGLVVLTKIPVPSFVEMLKRDYMSKIGRNMPWNYYPKRR